jgi:hypothetical protein
MIEGDNEIRPDRESLGTSGGNQAVLIASAFFSPISPRRMQEND